MAKDRFIFKQFSIRQSRCAMKVGTDGVLLGAWTPLEDVRHLLDVGAGTGLVALMTAQRLAQDVKADNHFTYRVDAVEIDGDAAMQAAENVAASPWADRIRVINADFRRFLLPTDVIGGYDLIVSNPPFFVDALRSPDSKRTQARHTDTLPFRILFSHSKHLLTRQGIVCLIIPTDIEAYVVEQAALEGFFPYRLTKVFTKPGKPCRRLLIAFSRELKYCSIDTLCIEAESTGYSDEYKKLTSAFYLS